MVLSFLLQQWCKTYSRLKWDSKSTGVDYFQLQPQALIVQVGFANIREHRPLISHLHTRHHRLIKQWHKLWRREEH